MQAVVPEENMDTIVNCIKRKGTLTTSVPALSRIFPSVASTLWCSQEEKLIARRNY
jgi:hypothetical protein